MRQRVAAWSIDLVRVVSLVQDCCTTHYYWYMHWLPGRRLMVNG